MTAPDPRDQRIADLEAKVARLEAIVEKLLEENAELKRRLNQNSTNSNQPPSSDGPDVQRPARKAKGKKRGGQPGHDPNFRALIPVEECRKVRAYKPRRCACGGCRFGPAKLRSRHQVIYLPRLVAPVDEHQSYAATCLDCGAESVEPIPPEVLCSAFGPCVVALIAQLVGEYRLSRRNVQRILADLFGITISLGGVSDQEQTASRAVASEVAEVRAEVRRAKQANADETSWRVESKKAWLWVAAVAGVCAAFVIHPRRNGEAAKALLGEAFAGVLGTDRWSSYNVLGALLRQLCWAHLIRDFAGWVELGGNAAWAGERLLEQTEKMFKWWGQLKDGQLSRQDFQKRMGPVRERVLSLLLWAETYAPEKVRGMAHEMLLLKEHLFTFVDRPGIEPTNNLAERMLRHAVIWRRLCYGCDSERGARFAERIMTVVATLKIQGRDVRGYLTSAVANYRLGLKVPPLLPAQP